MAINILGIIGTGVFLLMATVVIIFAYNSRPSKNHYIITPEENMKFMEDSISIQPSNKPIFSNEKIDNVIESGFNAMKQENYRLLKGVDKNAL